MRNHMRSKGRNHFIFILSHGALILLTDVCEQIKSVQQAFIWRAHVVEGFV